MTSELFGKTRSECAEWLATKVYHALLTTYRIPFSTWEQATHEQRAYCRRVAFEGIQEADTHLAAWGVLQPQDDEPVMMERPDPTFEFGIVMARQLSKLRR